MAKALLGHVPGDGRDATRLAAENARLRARVTDLETLVRRLQDENESLTTPAPSVDDLEMEPA